MTPKNADAIFAPALEAHLASGNPVGESRSFREYLVQHGFGPQSAKTPEYISIDHLAALPQSLRAANTMVLRLGRGRFALATSPTIEDLFLVEAQDPKPRETFLAPVSLRSLFPFTALGSVDDQALITLACAAGVMSYALEIDEPTVELPAAGPFAGTLGSRVASVNRNNGRTVGRTADKLHANPGYRLLPRVLG